MAEGLPLVVSCEHGGCRVPAALRPLFAGSRKILTSHRGWDPGALELARSLARRLGAPLVASTTTRLLVDANRSPSNPAVFSRFSAGLGPEARRRLLAAHHTPHWQKVEAALAAAAAQSERRGPRRPVVHLSVHSFTPALNGERRRADVGLLYDPSRGAERALASRWLRAFREQLPELVVRRNYPYRGTSDGLTRALRRRLPDAAYAGIEFEINQRWVVRGAARWTQLQRSIACVLAMGLAGEAGSDAL